MLFLSSCMNLFWSFHQESVVFEDGINCCSVHLVGHNGFNAVPVSLACKFVEKRCNLFGENRMRLIIPLQISNASLGHTSFLPASCRHKFSEWAQQCTGRVAGCSARTLVETPDLLPCMLAAPSYACPQDTGPMADCI